MEDHVRQSLLTDLRYAMRQLREYQDCGRALDALERMEMSLEDNIPLSAEDLAEPGTMLTLSMQPDSDDIPF